MAWRVCYASNVDSVVVLLVFSLGVIVQSVLMVMPKKPSDITYLSGSILGAIGIAAFMYITDPVGLEIKIVLANIVFIVAVSMLFKHLILPVINERTLLIWNSIIIYLYLSSFLEFSVIGAVLIVGSLFTVVFTFFHIVPGFLLRVILYCWFMLMVVLFGITQFAFNFIPALSQGATQGPYEVFINGMVTMYVGTHVFYLLAFIPFPTKQKTLQVRIHEVKNHARTISEKFSQEQLSPFSSVIILLLLSVVFILNSLFHILTPYALGGVLVILSYLLESRGVRLQKLGKDSVEDKSMLHA